MPNKSHTPSDLSILDDDLPVGRTFTLPQGIRLVVKKEAKELQARFRANGRDTTKKLGNYPDISFEDALIKAGSFIKEELAKSGITRNQKGKRSPIKSDGKNRDTILVIRSRSDCFYFVQKLFRLTGISLQMRQAIWLQLIIPASSDELLGARWEWFLENHQYLNFEAIKLESATKPRRHRYTYLSKCATKSLIELRTYTGHTGYLFPELHELRKIERDKLLTNIIKDVWPSYKVSLDGLRHTFESMAIEHSEFKPEFIASVMNHQLEKHPDYKRFYEGQVRLLLDWWGDTLEKGKLDDDFESPYTKWS